MQLIKNCEPKNVCLVHGENIKMDFLKNQIMKEFSKYFIILFLYSYLYLSSQVSILSN